MQSNSKYTDEQFVEKLRDYLGSKVVPVFKNSTGILREKTLNLPAFGNMPVDVKKDLLS